TAKGYRARVIAQAFAREASKSHWGGRDFRQRSWSVKLSTRGRYAAMAMVDLASRGPGRPVALADISARHEISLSYLEQLFARLRREGLVKSVRGPGGGYLLGRPADLMPVADIILAVDEPIKATRCFDDGKKKGCTTQGRCLTHDLWEELG